MASHTNKRWDIFVRQAHNYAADKYSFLDSAQCWQVLLWHSMESDGNAHWKPRVQVHKILKKNFLLRLWLGLGWLLAFSDI